jgi:F-type H+-transporting ATPase subunit gamma
MATPRALKNRIKSTKSIQQITKAMQAVSAVKMRKSESAAIAGRPYALSALEILKNIRRALKEEEAVHSPLVKERHVEKIALVVVTSDKGLAGSFNTNVLRRSQEYIKHHPDKTIDIIAVGKKGRDYFRSRGRKITAEFFESGDLVTVEEALPIANFLTESFLKHDYDEVVLIYTNFISALKQVVVTRKILPVTIHALDEITKHIIPDQGMFSGMPQAVDRALNNDKHLEYTFEPSPQKVLNKMIPALVNIEIYQSILEANASEHSSRMVAMKNASENAKELIGDMRIEYNKVRQAQITKELTEISAGAEAINN